MRSFWTKELAGPGYDELPAYAKLDRDGVVAAFKANGYDLGDVEYIESCKFLKMSLNGRVAHYEIVWTDDDDEKCTATVYIEPDANGVIKGEF
jgi:hypothetical protein